MKKTSLQVIHFILYNRNDYIVKDFYMKKYIKVGLVQAANIFELFIAGILALGVLFFTTQLVGSLFKSGILKHFIMPKNCWPELLPF